MARNLNENNLAGIENPDLYIYVEECIPLASSDYILEFIRGTNKEILDLSVQMQIHTLRGKMWCVARFGTIWLQPVTLLKLTLLHGCFSPF